MTLHSPVVAPWEPPILQPRSYARIPDVLDLPNMIQMQVDSFEWFKREGLRELLDEVTPITSFNKDLELQFLDYSFGEPKYSEYECRQRDATLAVPLKVVVRLVNKNTGEVKDQEIFMGDFPTMTPNGTFVINGAERVVVSQLVRSPGVYFTTEEDATSGRMLCHGKLIPNRGAWLEFETSNKDVLSVKVDRKRKIPVTTLLRAICSLPNYPKEILGTGSDEDFYRLFREADNIPDHPYIARTIDKEPIDTRKPDGAVIEFYKRLRPGDPPTLENAREFFEGLFFHFRRYDLGKVGRFKLNKRLGVNTSLAQRTLTTEDLVKIVECCIRVNNGVEHEDDIDHLGNRRSRAVGELIQNQFRKGLLRLERLIKERMSIQDPEQMAPTLLINNVRPVVAAMREFFGGSQLSQFMDQTNPLAELAHKRRLSALGPGGLSRERAGFDVRDVHHSHYGRICPIETPEGPNIGLIGQLATYGRVNDYGFIETPYRRVIHEVENTVDALLGKTLSEDVNDPATAEVIARKDESVTAELAARLAALPPFKVKIAPRVTDELVYLSADEEEPFAIAQANTSLKPNGDFAENRVSVRRYERFLFEAPERVEYMDVSPKQIVSVATALIPFLEHDDANRALMGSNMQRQAVPLLIPQSPVVSTGIESQTARDSGQVVMAAEDGVIESVTGVEVTLRGDSGQVHSDLLQKFVRSNQGTCIDQRPSVFKGQRVKKGDVIVDSSSTCRGELALGQNILVAFMSWEGGNFEDAILISERLVRDDIFTSIHIEKHELEARDTKLGPEEITRDIPNVSEDSLRNLDEQGIVRLGAEVTPGDILVGKITPKGETELTAEDKLLRAIFGEKAREVKDSSLRVPHGEKGRVIEIRTFSKADRGSDLPVGVNEMVRVSIAQKRKISEGDKMAGRHGNKGVISKVVPIEDMPFLPDGTAIDIIMSPIGVPSRMNVGQILEAHLGWAADRLGMRAINPVFDSANEREIEAALARAWMKDRGMDVSIDDISSAEANTAALRRCFRAWLLESGDESAQDLPEEALEEYAAAKAVEWALPLPTCGKSLLYDGRTGDAFDSPVTVGNIYMMKLAHLVEDKIHARSTGPYSLVTQQPLGGKAQFGGQRFGEMEVWALEAYGAAHILQEMLTVKSDDVLGRVRTYEAIVKGENISEPGVPESFKVLVKELQSLGLAVEVMNEGEERIQFVEESEDAPVLGLEGINLSGFETGE
jgi:DNA-directed RNA polymerase subunit beta